MVIFLLRYNVGNIDIIVFVIVTESERLRERERERDIDILLWQGSFFLNLCFQRTIKVFLSFFLSSMARTMIL